MTLAHTTMAARARDACEHGAWLVFVPAGRNPLKREAPSAGDADRIRMLEIACRGIPRYAIWTDEIDRAREGASGSASFTIDTVERARRVLPNSTRLRLLIGADQSVGFHRWRAFRRILNLAPAIVIPRGGIHDGAALANTLRAVGVWSNRERSLWSAWFVEMAEMEVSATRVRELLRSRDHAGVESLVDADVVAFIRSRRLYEE